MNSAFKQALEWEAEHVFLNPCEFAESTPAVINGVALTLQVIGLTSSLQDSSDGRPGITYQQAVLHIKSGQIPLPRADRSLNWNGTEWIVLEAKDNHGLYRVELYREVS